MSALNTDKDMRCLIAACWAAKDREEHSPSYPVPGGATPHPKRSNWGACLTGSGLPLHECMSVEDYAFRYLIGAENLSVDQIMMLERGTDHDVAVYRAQRYLEDMREVTL